MPGPSVPSRIAWVDIAKGFAMFLVVFGHTIPIDSPFLRPVFLLHMPAMFILAGYTLRPKPMGAVLVSSFKRLLIPYCVLSFILLAERAVEAAPGELDLLGYLKIFVLGSGANWPTHGIEAIGMPWFLVCLFWARILVNAVMRLYERTSLPFGWTAVPFFLFAALGYYIGTVRFVFLPLSFDVALIASFYLWFGMLFRRYDGIVARALSMHWPALVFFGVWAVSGPFCWLEMATRTYDNPLVCLVGSLSGALTVFYLATLAERLGFFGRFFQFVGKNSMQVYSMHALDWFLPWGTTALFSTVPFGSLWLSIVRFLFDCSFAFLGGLAPTGGRDGAARHS